MSSFLWLLLYLAPLLGVTAAVFAWFGWQWRGSDLLKRIEALQTELEEARRRQEESVRAPEGTEVLEREIARLLRDLEEVRAAHAATQAELAGLREVAAVEPAAVEPAASETKPKRKRSPTTKAKAAAAGTTTVSLHEIIVGLETRLAAFQASTATLTQERDEWQRRIGTQESASPADTASLADIETRLSAGMAEVERLQNQTQVLLHVESEAAALAGVPDDDLTQIKGLKKGTREQLRAHGIRTWRQIALWSDKEQRAFSELLGLKNRITREQWQEQARALHAAAQGTLL